MKIRYIHETDLGNGHRAMANIMWQGTWPKRKGDFPPGHPCIVNAAGLEAFRARGYWASPFPEGDGLTMDPKGRTAAEVIADIEQCFGWEVNEPGA